MWVEGSACISSCWLFTKPKSWWQDSRKYSAIWSKTEYSCRLKVYLTGFEYCSLWFEVSSPSCRSWCGRCSFKVSQLGRQYMLSSHQSHIQCWYDLNTMLILNLDCFPSAYSYLWRLNNYKITDKGFRLGKAITPSCSAIPESGSKSCLKTQIYLYVASDHPYLQREVVGLFLWLESIKKCRQPDSWSQADFM